MIQNLNRHDQSWLMMVNDGQWWSTIVNGYWWWLIGCLSLPDLHHGIAPGCSSWKNRYPILSPTSPGGEHGPNSQIRMAHSILGKSLLSSSWNWNFITNMRSLESSWKFSRCIAWTHPCWSTDVYCSCLVLFAAAQTFNGGPCKRPIESWLNRPESLTTWEQNRVGFLQTDLTTAPCCETQGQVEHFTHNDMRIYHHSTNSELT